MSGLVPHVVGEDDLLSPEQRRAVLAYYEARVEPWGIRELLVTAMCNRAIDWFNEKEGRRDED